MRRKIYLITLLASLGPFVGYIVALLSVAPLQKEGLASRRLAFMFDGCMNYFGDLGAEVQAKARALAVTSEIAEALIPTPEKPFNHAVFIESIVKEFAIADLDYLAIVDTAGTILALGHDPTLVGFSVAGDPLFSVLLDGQEVQSVALREIKGKRPVMITAGCPVWSRSKVIGAVLAGQLVDERRLENLKTLSGAEFIVIAEGVAKAGTIQGDFDQSILFLEDNAIQPTRLGQKAFRFASFPWRDHNGNKVAEMVIGVDISDIETTTNNFLRLFILLAGGAFVLATSLSWRLSRSMIVALADLNDGLTRLAAGDFEVSLALSRKDELGKLQQSFNSLATELNEMRHRIREEERETILMHLAEKLGTRLRLIATIVKQASSQLPSVGTIGGDDFTKLVERQAQVIAGEASSLERVASTLADFGGHAIQEIKLVDLNLILGEVASALRDEMSGGNMIVHKAEEPLMVHADPTQIAKAIQNLIQNACEAAGPTGQVTIRGLIERKEAVIEISDNGPGFSELAKKNLFAPFFSTKPQACGLGLALAKKIVAEHEGRIAIDDSREGGAKVAIRLPLAQT